MGLGRSFRWTAAAVFALLAAANYLPAFQARIPFPRDLVLVHAAYNGWPREGPLRSFPEIGDLINSFYPYHALAGKAAREGTIPLWNPYILSGSPLEASSQAALFYPFNLLYYVLPLPVAWTASLFLRVFLAGFFMALLVRQSGGSTAGSIVSGIIFALCGFMTAWQGQAMADAAIWLPLICYAVQRMHASRSGRSVAFAALVFAMPILAGHPETGAHLAMVGSAMALFFWIVPATPETRSFDLRFLGCFILTGLLALGLASIQIIPTLEWIRHIGSSFDAPWPALTRHDGQGFFSRDLLTSPNSGVLRIPEAAAYIGMLGFLAAPLALLHRSRRQVLFLAGITVIGAAVAFSVNPVHWIVDHLPVLKSLKNGRFILVVSFGIAALAGLGISELENSRTFGAVKRRLAAALVGGTFLLAAFALYEIRLSTPPGMDFMRGPGPSLIFLIAAGTILAWKLSGGLPGRSFSILACAATGFELLTFSYGYTGFAKAADIFPAAPVFDFFHAQGDTSSFRIAKAGYPIPANSGIMYDVQMAEGYEAVTERTRTFSRGLTEEREDAVFFQADKVVASKDRRIDMLNVRFFAVITPSTDFDEFSRSHRFREVFKKDAVAVFENSSVLPRLLAVPQSGLTVIKDEASQMERIRDAAFDPEQTVVISEQPPGVVQDNSAAPFSSSIQLIKGGLQESVFRTLSSAPSVQVLSQMYYPGWRATIDGDEVPVYPVDYALTGILVPAGAHEVRFFFQPAGFRAGALLSLLSLCVVLGMGIVYRAHTAP